MRAAAAAAETTTPINTPSQRSEEEKPRNEKQKKAQAAAGKRGDVLGLSNSCLRFHSSERRHRRTSGEDESWKRAFGHLPEQQTELDHVPAPAAQNRKIRLFIRPSTVM